MAATINANGATDVAVNAKAGATFSETMNANTINSTNFLLKELLRL